MNQDTLLEKLQKDNTGRLYEKPQELQ